MSYIKRLGRKFKDRSILNLHQTNYDKNVLISYITRPFRSKSLDFSHTNNAEIRTITDVFKRLEYNVDIVHFEQFPNLDYGKYDLIFGFGHSLCQAFYDPAFTGKAIFYATGMHVCTQNTNALNRIKEFRNHNNVYIPESARIVPQIWTEQTNLVDALFIIGNDKCVDSYRCHTDLPIYRQPVSFYPIFEKNKSIQNLERPLSEKRDYLWFNSSGMIHKGLDLVLEYFEKKPNLNLHVCGPIENEKRFQAYYKKQLYETKNIKTYGFMNIHSPDFLTILSKCRFIISPSCAEGEPSAIVNNIAAGLLPIVSTEGGYRDEWSGIVINELTQKGLHDAITESLTVSDQSYVQKAIKNIEYIYSWNSLSNFENIFSTNLKQFLAENS